MSQPSTILDVVQIPPPDRVQLRFWLTREEHQKIAALAAENGVAIGELARSILNAYVDRWNSSGVVSGEFWREKGAA